jgi:hypothetical protein
MPERLDAINSEVAGVIGGVIGDNIAREILRERRR